MSDDQQHHLQVPCAMCGQLTDLPAVWTCACGQYRLCNRSACKLAIPARHRDGECGVDKNEETIFPTDI
jgi:hypothetical protein